MTDYVFFTMTGYDRVLYLQDIDTCPTFDGTREAPTDLTWCGTDGTRTPARLIASANTNSRLPMSGCRKMVVDIAVDVGLYEGNKR